MKRPMNWLLVGVLLASFLAGCATPTPQVIEKEVVVEKEVPVTVVVEKEVAVEKEVVKEVPVEVTRVVEKEVTAPVSEVREWKLVNPEGVVVVEPVEIAPRLASLEGKTVLLRWNGKHNGNNFLDRIAELLAEQVPTAKIIKMWEAIPGSNGYPMKDADFQAALELKPDILIASQAD